MHVYSRALLLLAAGMVGLIRAAAAPALPQPEVQAYARQVEAELRGDILPFWLAHARDRERGGFYGEIEGNLEVKKNAPRGALLTSRVLWTFSAAYRRYHDPEYLAMARWAYDDLLAHFWDQKDGGVYWRVSADGKPLDARKILYGQAFAIYGLSEYSRATGEQAPLDRAIEIYRLIERYAHDQAHLGYFEELTRDWKVSRDRGRFGSAMGSLDQKSQNVHLHVMEALANLYRVWPDPGLKARLHEVADLMLDVVLDSRDHHLRLFLAEDWTPRSDEISFGHDIEFSWLMVETAELLGDQPLIERAKKEAVAIATVTLQQGVDTDGGVLAEANPKGITNRFKEWWPQAEATIGFLGAYQLSGDRKFFDASRGSWNFIETKLVDHKNGEWLQGISGDGRHKVTVKVSFWKCPYHNSRACMEVLDRLRSLQTAP